MLVIGLTGGIGSGKTTVSKMFQKLGIPIYYSDDEAKKLMQTSKIIKRKLVNNFGNEVYLNGKLNKPFLANLIFTNPANLAYVNSVVHPKVKQHFTRWLKKQALKTNLHYVIQENAILFENRSDQYCDFVITVTAPENIKIDRVVQRDKTTKDKVLERMENQWNDSLKIEKSDFIIENLDLETVKKQVLKIHNVLNKTISEA